jgi:hypothetical protein
VKEEWNEGGTKREGEREVKEGNIGRNKVKEGKKG